MQSVKKFMRLVGCVSKFRVELKQHKPCGLRDFLRIEEATVCLPWPSVIIWGLGVFL